MLNWRDKMVSTHSRQGLSLSISTIMVRVNTQMVNPVKVTILRKTSGFQIRTCGSKIGCALVCVCCSQITKIYAGFHLSNMMPDAKILIDLWTTHVIAIRNVLLEVFFETQAQLANLPNFPDKFAENLEQK